MSFTAVRLVKPWTPTGTNVPDYPALADLWWKNAALVANDKLTPKQVMDKLALEMDARLQVIADKGQSRCEPKLNPEKDEVFWLGQPGAPKPRLEDEKPPGRTQTYEESLKAWQ